MVAMQGFHVVLSDMCHSTMGSSSADVLRSLDLASCAAELAVGPLQPDPHPSQHFPPVHNPLPAHPSTSTQQQSSQPQAPEQQSSTEQESGRMDGSNGLLLPKGNLVMKLLQVCQAVSYSLSSILEDTAGMSHMKQKHAIRP